MDESEVMSTFGFGKLPQDVFQHFMDRRKGIITALTQDLELLWEQCDPAVEPLALFAYPDGSWLVASDVPTMVPGPNHGINLLRGTMLQAAWVAYVADQSDSWLLALSFYLAARCSFDDTMRQELFEQINGVPTIRETVCEDVMCFICNAVEMPRDPDAWCVCSMCGKWYHAFCSLYVVSGPAPSYVEGHPCIECEPPQLPPGGTRPLPF